MARVRSTDLLIRDLLLEYELLGHPLTVQEVIETYRSTFNYAAAEFHDTVIDLILITMGKEPVQYIYECKGDDE